MVVDVDGGRVERPYVLIAKWLLALRPREGLGRGVLRARLPIPNRFFS